MKKNPTTEAPNIASNPQMQMDNNMQMPMSNPMQNNMMQMDNNYEVGGQTKSNIFKGFFNDINILDVMLSAFIVGGILYVVYYYRHQMAKDKTIFTDFDTRLSTIEKQVKKVNSELNATGKSKKRNVVRM